MQNKTKSKKLTKTGAKKDKQKEQGRKLVQTAQKVFMTAGNGIGMAMAYASSFRTVLRGGIAGGAKEVAALLPSSNAIDVDAVREGADGYRWEILGGLAIGLVMVALVLARCSRVRGQRSSRAGSKGIDLDSKESAEWANVMLQGCVHQRSFSLSISMQLCCMYRCIVYQIG